MHWLMDENPLKITAYSEILYWLTTRTSRREPHYENAFPRQCPAMARNPRIIGFCDASTLNLKRQ